MEDAATLIVALVGLAGSILVAFVSLVTNNRTLRRQESTRHEDMRREAYPEFVRLADMATLELVSALVEDRPIDASTLNLPEDWGSAFQRAQILIDFVGSQRTSTEAREYAAAVYGLMDFVEGKGHPRFTGPPAMQFMMSRSQLHVRRAEFLNAARADVELPRLAFHEPRPTPHRMIEWFGDPTQDTPSMDTSHPFAWADEPQHGPGWLWRRLPRRVKAWVQHRFHSWTMMRFPPIDDDEPYVHPPEDDADTDRSGTPPAPRPPKPRRRGRR